MQALARLENVELEVAGLVRVVAGIDLPAGTLPQRQGQLPDDPLYWLGVVAVRAEVPAFGEGRAVRLARCWASVR